MSSKTVLILGANSDIGFALAEKFSLEGYSVLLAARNTQAIEQRLRSMDRKTEMSIVPFDAMNFQAHKSWFYTLPTMPDITCCAFGYLGEQSKAQEEWEEASTIISSNYTGAVAILNVVAAAYKNNTSGQIIGISSVAGDRGRQSNYIYGSAKAGFSAYLSGLRNALYKHGVHVLTVKPGFVATKMTAGLPLPKMLTATPEQVANRIIRASHRRLNSIYVFSIWYWIMLVIKLIPEFIFKRLKL